MIPSADAPAVRIQSELESVKPLQEIVEVCQPNTTAEPLTEIIIVGRFGTDHRWHPVVIPLAESASPWSLAAEVSERPESFVDELEYDPPLIAGGIVKFTATRGDWPSPEWEY